MPALVLDVVEGRREPEDQVLWGQFREEVIFGGHEFLSYSVSCRSYVAGLGRPAAPRGSSGSQPVSAALLTPLAVRRRLARVQRRQRRRAEIDQDETLYPQALRRPGDLLGGRPVRRPVGEHQVLALRPGRKRGAFRRP